MKIEEVRNNIDKVDDQLLDLFMERMALAEQVAAYKKEHQLPLTNAEREREILSRRTKEAGKLEPYIHRYFAELFSLSKSYQSQFINTESGVGKWIDEAVANGGEMFPRTGSIAVQGIEGSNSQTAAEKILTRGNITFFKTFEAVFDAVESGLCKFGILPIENSMEGSVRKVYELLQSKKFSVVRSVRINVRHELMAKPGTKLSDITEIYSHEQALGQSSTFLATLPEVKHISWSNTALAAKHVAESSDKNVAAIASHQNAGIYGLEVLESDIQDNDNNYTRFICIQKDPIVYAGANRISIITDTAHKPGALHEVLSNLAALGINMSKLESVPVSGRNFEFKFFIDMEASVLEPGVKEMLEELERTSESFVMLGNYQEI